MRLYPLVIRLGTNFCKALTNQHHSRSYNPYFCAMAKMYQLSTCSTCKRIISELGEQPSLEIVNIKTEPITEEQISKLREKACCCF